jgi:uncharacterized protein (UPF0276 family)
MLVRRAVVDLVIVDAVVVAVVVVVGIESLKSIPKLGMGLGYRSDISEEIKSNQSAVDFLEIIPEQFFNRNYETILGELKNDFVMIPHGVDLSLGSASGIDKEHLKKLKKVIDFINPPYWSEHLSFTQSRIHNIGHLSPIVRTQVMLDLVVENINKAVDVIEKPLIIENVTYMVDFKNQEMTEPDFFNRLYEKTGTGVLLDITNLYINSQNHGFDPNEYLNQLNPEAVIQAHIIGFEKKMEVIIDSHSTALQRELWEFCDVVLSRFSFKSVILEWDKNFPEDFDAILSELETGRTKFFDK